MNNQIERLQLDLLHKNYNASFYDIYNDNFTQEEHETISRLFREALAELAVKTPANAPDPPPSTQPPNAAPEAAGGQPGAITEGFRSLGPDSSAKAVISALCSTRNESEWNTICDAVKRNGQYPPWWFSMHTTYPLGKTSKCSVKTMRPWSPAEMGALLRHFSL